MTSHLGHTECDENQKSFSDKLNKIQSVKFRNIPTQEMLWGMPKTTKSETKTPANNLKEVSNNFDSFAKTHLKQNIRDTFDVPLNDVQFKHGCVSFDKKFYEHRETLHLTIPNPDIQEEYDAVKNYFANVLKTKKIKVTVNIEVTDHVVTSIEVKSPEIDRIDKSLIDNVRIEYIKSTIKTRNDIDTEKNIFTMEEYLHASRIITMNLQTNPFYYNDKELFEDLVSISKTKHYRHLRLLSSKHSHQIMKLRFVHKPLSFIFLIPGKENYHIVWGNT